MTPMSERLYKLLNISAEEAARIAEEKTRALAQDTSVKFTEEIRWGGFTYGRVEPVPRQQKL